MPSRKTIPFHITKKTNEEIERIRVILSKETGIDVSKITKKHAEIVLRIKSQRGKIFKNEVNDVLLGKIE